MNLMSIESPHHDLEWKLVTDMHYRWLRIPDEMTNQALYFARTANEMIPQQLGKYAQGVLRFKDAIFFNFSFDEYSAEFALLFREYANKHTFSVKDWKRGARSWAPNTIFDSFSEATDHFKNVVSKIY